MFICSHWYCSCKQGIKRFFAERCSLSFPLVPTNLYLTSVGKLGSQLSIRKNEEKYVEVCLVTLCANKTPSIILGQSQKFPSRNSGLSSLMSFWWSYSVVCEAHFCLLQSLTWYAEVMHCSVPVILCKTLLNSLTNSFPWVFIHPCWRITL